MAYLSVSLLNLIFDLKSTNVIINTIFAIFVNLCITGVFAFAGFALPTYRLLPDGFYNILNSKSVKMLYNRTKAEWFRDFLLATFWKNKNKQKQFFDGTRTHLMHLVNQTKSAEFGHLMPLMIIGFLSIVFAVQVDVYLGLATMLINIFFNFYPIVLQRHHRMRVQLLRLRLDRNKA